MSAWDEFPGVRKVEVLGDQESFFSLRGTPDVRVRTSNQFFVKDGMDVMTQVIQRDAENTRKILIQLEVHRMRGVSGVGKSSSAEAAANAIAA